MSFSGSQQADLMQAALAGTYTQYLEWEGAWLQDSSEGSINIPWVLAISLAQGNATTKAIGEGAWLWSEPEWGWDATGLGKDIGPQDQMWLGGGVGGWIRSW